MGTIRGWKGKEKEHHDHICPCRGGERMVRKKSEKGHKNEEEQGDQRVPMMEDRGDSLAVELSVQLCIVKGRRRWLMEPYLQRRNGRRDGKV